MQDPIGRRFRVQNVVQRSDQHRRESTLASVPLAMLKQEVVRCGQCTFSDPERTYIHLMMKPKREKATKRESYRLTIENTKIDTRVPLQANAVHFTRTRMASRIPAAESTFCRNFTIGKRPQDINHLVFPTRQWEY